MSKSGIVFHKKTTDPEQEAEVSVLKDLLKEKVPNIDFLYLDNLKEFINFLNEKKPDFVVFDWSAYHAPTEVVEAYYQSLSARSPLIIFFEFFSDEDLAFLREYNIEETVRVFSKNKKREYLPIAELINSLLAPQTDKIKKRIIEAQIHHRLNNHKVTEAFELYKKIHPILPEQERVFYQAKMLKEQKKYKEAALKINNEKNKTLRLMGLMGSVLYQMGNHASAVKFLELSNCKSPRNLRRNYMLYASYNELAKSDSQFRSKAMSFLMNILKLSPNYNGVKEKIITLVMENQTVDNIPLISSLLSMATSKEITKIFKKIETYEEPFRTPFIDKFIRALSEKANELILQDDITALKYYTYIKKLLPATATERLMTLDYCVARAYFRFGQLEIAKEKNDSIMERSNGTHAKAAALKVLIEKALRGEFDVLLDDEKDWLKEA